MLSYKTIRPDTLELLKHLMAEPLFAICISLFGISDLNK